MGIPTVNTQLVVCPVTHRSRNGRILFSTTTSLADDPPTVMGKLMILFALEDSKESMIFRSHGLKMFVFHTWHKQHLASKAAHEASQLLDLVSSQVARSVDTARLPCEDRTTAATVVRNIQESVKKTPIKLNNQ